MFTRSISRVVVLTVVAALVAALFPVSAAFAADGTIAYGQAVSGQLSNMTYFELWQFSGTRGDRVQILMQGDGVLDPYLGLIDGATEEVIVEDDDSGGNGDAYIETTLSATGAYYIVATRYGFDTGTTQGSYQLALAGGSGPQDVATTNTTGGPQELSPGVFMMGELLLGTPVAEAIHATSYAHVYSVNVTQPTELLVAMFADASTLDSYIIFADADGNVLAEDDDSGGQVGGASTDSFLQLTVNDAGSYLVVASRAGLDQGTSAGNYVLVAGVPEATETPEQPQPTQDQELPAGVEGMAAIAVGGQASGAINSNSFVHLYPLQGTAGEQITITMTGASGLDAYLGLIDPNDEVIAEDDDSGGGTNAQISIKLPESGTYLIVATRNGVDAGTSAGNYTLSVTGGLPPAPEGVTTTTGGFGGLPGRSFDVGEDTFFLRGYGRSSNPDKNTPLESFFESVQPAEELPGRSFDVGGTESFYLSGFGRSDNPDKASPLQSYLAELLNP